jgi:c-di-GMP-binding flagellar brake protein YcgR
MAGNPAMALSSLKQREHYRVPLEAQAIVETNDGRSLKGVCLNISMGGMCLSLEHEITRNMPGRVSMLFEQDGETIEFCAQFFIAWTRTERPDIPVKYAGIQFVGLDNENRSCLTKIIIARLMKLEKDRREGTPESIKNEENKPADYYPPFLVKSPK